MVRNTTRNRNRLNAGPLQQQGGAAESLQYRFGMMKGKSQTIQTGPADQLRTHIRNAAGMCCTLMPSPAATTATT
ncbi:MAG: hypothetical protein ACQXXC_10075 [Methanolinea tarda]|nr:hypothetical protein [Methanolinea sp.]